MLRPLPTASLHTRLSGLEISLSEVMAPSGLVAAVVPRMKKPAGLAPMGPTLPHALRQRHCMWVFVTPRNYCTTSDEILRLTKHL